MLLLNGTIGTKGPQSNRCDHSVEKKRGRQGRKRKRDISQKRKAANVTLTQPLPYCMRVKHRLSVSTASHSLTIHLPAQTMLMTLASHIRCFNKQMNFLLSMSAVLYSRIHSLPRQISQHPGPFYVCSAGLSMFLSYLLYL